MICLTSQDIKDAFEMISLNANEQIILGRITNETNVYVSYIYYKNKRVSYLYKVFFQRKDKNIMYIYTHLKSEDDQKNITRTKSNISFSDRIIYCIATYSMEKLGLAIYPDFIEGKRILKHLGTEARCYPLIQKHKDDSMEATFLYKIHGF